MTADDRGSAEAAEYGIKFVKQALTRENFKRVLDPLVGRGDFLLNLSVDVSSIALIKLCWDKAALYLPAATTALHTSLRGDSGFS